MSFDKEYEEMRKFVMKGETIENKRTHEKLVENFGYSFRWNSRYLPVLTIRQINPLISIAEAIWMMSGEKSINWLKKYTQIWNDFSDDNNNVDSAYGYRITREFKLNQIKHVIFRLKIDSTNRQCYINLWNPLKDNLQQQRNTPCLTSLQFCIVKGKLNMYVHFRSNDLILGVPSDILTMFFILKMVSSSLELDSGIIFYSISNLHIYSKHIEEFNKISKPTYELWECNSPSLSYESVVCNKDFAVYNFLDLVKNTGYNYTNYPKLNFKISL